MLKKNIPTLASSNCAKLFLLALALVLALKPLAVSTQRVINLSFDVVDGNIEDLYDMLKVALLEAQPQPFRLGVEGHLVLVPQRRNKKSPSDPMIHLHLTGEYEDEATIFITVDDLSICGFANKSGEKFILEGYNSFFPRQHELSFGGEYSQLIHGGIGPLHTVPLGRQSMLHGLHAFSWHNPEVGDPVIVNKQAKLGVCRFSMMVSESLRLIPIHDSFAPLFDLENFASHEDCELVQSYWGDISKELLKWKAFNFWDDGNKKLRQINITDATTALQKVDVVLREF